MSWERFDDRALSLEEVFLSREFGQVPPGPPPAVEPHESGTPRRGPAGAGHRTTTHRRRSRTIGAVSGIAAAVLVALGLATGTGKGTPDKPGGVKTASPPGAPPPNTPGTGTGSPPAPARTVDALVGAAPASPGGVSVVRTSAPVQADFPVPAAPPTPPPPPAPPPPPGPPPVPHPAPSAGPPPPPPPLAGPGELVSAATELVGPAVTSAGNVVTGVVSTLASTLPGLPLVPPSIVPPSVTSVVGGLTVAPFGAG